MTKHGLNELIKSKLQLLDSKKCATIHFDPFSPQAMSLVLCLRGGVRDVSLELLQVVL